MQANLNTIVKISIFSVSLVFTWHHEEEEGEQEEGGGVHAEAAVQADCTHQQLRHRLTTTTSGPTFYFYSFLFFHFLL